jgi:Flp pilus assembly protein TadG
MAIWTRAIVKSRAAAARLGRDRQGVAAVEFAMIVPIMFVMFIGAVEMSQAVTVDRRVSQVASATADLVARAESTIKIEEIFDIMKIGSYLMEPYPHPPLTITMRNVASTTSSATNTGATWTCIYVGATSSVSVPFPQPNCTCTTAANPTREAYTLPVTGLVGLNDSVVVAEVEYRYKPPIFDYFMRMAFPSAGGTYTLRERIFLKPRGQAAKLERNTAGVTCV